MKKLLSIFKKKKKSPLAKKIQKTRKQVKGLKLKLFLLYTLPVFIVTLGKAVWEEYSRIKVRQAAMNADESAQNDRI